MKATIIALGSELLSTTKLDKNSLHITEALELFGVDLIGKLTIGDNEKNISKAIKQLIPHTDLIITTGGLGPTTDDVTRSAVAEALGKSLLIDPKIEEKLRHRLTLVNRKMGEINCKQAMMIEGGTALENMCGIAPGICIEHQETTIFLLPGVPREVDHMIETYLNPWLKKHTSENGIQKRIERTMLKIACIPESEIEERILPAYKEFGREWITILGSPGEVILHLKAQGEETHRKTKLYTMQQRLRELIGNDVFSDQADWSLEKAVGHLLANQQNTLTTAESCTGGLLAERLTRISGSSDYFLGGIVPYSNKLKTALLGIKKEAMQKHGVVSKPIAIAMAQNVRLQYQSDYGIGLTGIAGPSGGSATKPVGTIHIALAGPDDKTITHHEKFFPGNRNSIRSQAAHWALNMLRQALHIHNEVSAKTKFSHNAVRDH